MYYRLLTVFKFTLVHDTLQLHGDIFAFLFKLFLLHDFITGRGPSLWSRKAWAASVRTLQGPRLATPSAVSQVRFSVHLRFVVLFSRVNAQVVFTLLLPHISLSLPSVIEFRIRINCIFKQLAFYKQIEIFLLSPGLIIL